MIVHVLELLGADVLLGVRAALDAAEWEDGRVSAKAVAPGVKKNLQAKDSPAIAEAQGTILGALQTSPDLVAASLPVVATAPLFSRYEPGMTYGRHIDSPVLSGIRTDLAVTVFLSTPEEYDGGELEIDELPPIKLPAGHVVVYPATRIHRVAEVTRGVRLAAVSWIQSRIQDERERAILHELFLLASAAEARDPQEALSLQRVRSELLRKWMDKP